MLVVEQNKYAANWSLGNAVTPLSYYGEAIIVFDPSKSNMAMVIGTPDGYILDTFEFSGNNRKRGPVMDTTLYCEEVRAFLKALLVNVDIYMVGLEQAIQKEGNNYYHSSMVLTEIRANLLNFFLETYGVKAIEINNWAWKFAILPKGYRSKYEKGSKKWFLNEMPESPYSKYFEADMTDCVCMYWFMIDKMCQSYTCFCNKHETCSDEINYFLSPISTTNDNRVVLFNSSFSLEENLAYYANRILKVFEMEVPTESLSLEDIYGKSIGFSLQDLNCDVVKVVAKRA